MKLAAIYNVFFDSVEFLPYSLSCLKGFVDEIIIIYQTTSNYGEEVEPYELFSEKFLENIFPYTGFTLYNYSPNLSYGGGVNETRKRNKGLDIAREKNCTHFLHLDCDELWDNFGMAKKSFINSGMKGSVAQMWTYFKKPTLRFENPDNYYVPFIHELRKDTVVGTHKYPYYVDPTRRVSGFLLYEANIKVIDEKMHHFSYCRLDIEMKIRNSSAKKNIEKSNLREDYWNPEVGAGFFVRDFGQKLIEVDNIFNIEI